MKDPVRLPTSGNTVERSTIKRILLNDEHDPFNRAPLTLAQIEDDIVMKERIQLWLTQKRNGEVTDEEKKQQQEQMNDLDPMTVDKEEESNMSVDKKQDESHLPKLSQEETHKSFEDMNEEEQMKYAMEMSMRNF